MLKMEECLSPIQHLTYTCPLPCHSLLPCALLMHSCCPGISSTSPASEAGIAIYRVALVRQLFERIEQDYGTFISGISIPFRTGKKHSGTLNRQMGIVTRFKTIEGEAVGIRTRPWAGSSIRSARVGVCLLR